MAARRGDHGINWDGSNSCYVGTISLGYDPAGKRLRKTVRGRTKTEVKTKLRELESEISAGIQTSATYTVQECVIDFLAELTLKPRTINDMQGTARDWIFPVLGGILVRDLKVADVDRLLAKMAQERRRSTVVTARSILRRAVRRAQKHDLIDRNVIDLTDLPSALPARKSRAMTVEQAQAVMEETSSTRLHALFAVSFSLGLRPGELRSLQWDDIDLDDRVIKVRRGLKNVQSERTLRIPQMVADVLNAHWEIQEQEREYAGSEWISSGLVFCHEDGRQYSKDDLLYRFTKVTKALGFGHWHPHEGRHTAVSILDHSGVPLSKIADYVGHKNDNVTRTVYRHIIEPEIAVGAEVMDDVFKSLG